MTTEAARFIGASIAVLCFFGIGSAMGNIFCTWMKAISRNPSVKDDLFPVGILGFALTESIALFALLIAFLILFKS